MLESETETPQPRYLLTKLMVRDYSRRIRESQKEKGASFPDLVARPVQVISLNQYANT